MVQLVRGLLVTVHRVIDRFRERVARLPDSKFNKGWSKCVAVDEQYEERLISVAPALQEFDKRLRDYCCNHVSTFAPLPRRAELSRADAETSTRVPI
jgi:hypothetical protein